MNIALIAHEKKKELMVQFCIAYAGILAKHNLCATATTGNLIADATGLHISTISRAVNGKYLQCPRGVLELRQFFTSALSAADGQQAISPEAVQARMRALIAEEDPRHPLSDAQLEQLLADEGITIARRTIAKYRDALRILPASQRRR